MLYDPDVSAPYNHPSTKTTFVLSDSRRARLKSLAIARQKTVTELLAEGADLVLEKYESVADRELLSERARRAREQLRLGLFHGSAPASVDEVVYATGSGAPRHTKRRKG